MERMPGHECYHCKQWVEESEAHDCWTTTEAALTRELSDDLQEAWERLRETARELGDQRIYASHNSIMFSRKSCYFFVRPEKTFLEICIFLGRTVKSPQVRRAIRSSKSKIAHLIQIRHRDQVEAPITDWINEAYETSDALSVKSRTAKPTRKKPKAKKSKAKVTPRRTRPAASSHRASPSASSRR
jgi:Domain of unknown function (DUF5655)